MRAALDTNLLVYAEGFGDVQRVSTTTAWQGAMDLCVAHQLASWDALGLNVAAEGGARLLLTEDLHSGFCWRGVRVVNPLVEPADPYLSQLLA